MQQLASLIIFAFISITAANAGFWDDPLGIRDAGKAAKETAAALQQEWKETRERLEKLTYDAVPGAAWLRLLRMSHEGTPAERKQAEDAIRSYFGVDITKDYSARIWIENGSKEPLEYDFFPASTNGRGEIINFVASDRYKHRIAGPNSLSLVSDQMRRDRFVNQLTELIGQKFGHANLYSAIAPFDAGNLKINQPIPSGQTQAIAASEVLKCYYTRGEPNPEQRLNACRDILTKSISTQFATEFRNLLTEYLTQDLRPTQQNTWEVNWAITNPYLFVLLRKDQFERIKKEGLKITVAVSPKDKPDVTFQNLGPFLLPLELFDRFEPVELPNFSYKLIGAVVNMGGTGFNGPDQLRAIEELTAKWEEFRQRARRNPG